MNDRIPLDGRVPWSAGRWTHEPLSVRELGDSLIVHAAPMSDAWRTSSYGFIHESEHALVRPVSSGVSIEVSFEARPPAPATTGSSLSAPHRYRKRSSQQVPSAALRQVRGSRSRSSHQEGELWLSLLEWAGFSSGPGSKISKRPVGVSVGRDAMDAEEIGPEQRTAYRRIVGYELRCAWDTEHGVGVMTHEDRVVEVGQADTALLGAHDPARDVRQTSRLGSVRSP